MKWHRVVLISLVSLAWLFVSNSTGYAADRMYDMGRSYGTFLNGVNMGSEMNVMSAQARGGGVNGVERVRAWGRLDNIRKKYPQSLGYYSWINGADIRLTSDDGRRDFFFVHGVNPGDVSKPTYLDRVFYEIAGYKGIPTNLLQTYVNEFAVSGISTAGISSADAIRTFKGSNASSINLPNGVPYTNADGGVAGKSSSAQSYFGYTIGASTYSNFRLWPQARVQYGFSYNSSAPWYYWTNYAGVKHLVNRT